MRLQKLLEGVEYEPAFHPVNEEASGLAYDSRRVKSGNLFVALKGEKTDGNIFVDQAVARGAAIVVSEMPPPALLDRRWIQVRNGRQALARMSANFFGHPTRKLDLIGITGTNGKTSTAYLIEAILKAAGAKVGLISTIEYRGPEGAVAAERTTPESLDLQELFSSFLNQGCRQVVMEVSSHALVLDRVHACRFRTAVFTNLTADHLDYHGTLQNYYEAKKQLFLGTGFDPPQQSIINLDDTWGRNLVDTCLHPVTYSIGGTADFQLLDFQTERHGMRLKMGTPSGIFNLKTRLLGRPNIANVLAAVASSQGLGVEQRAIQSGVESCPPIPGRFELVDCGQQFRVIVDYAHTADALEKVLSAARELNSNRVLLVFGCGGERDRTKRPAMGAVAEELSHFCLVTSDNPRGEDPLKIIEEIESGFKGKSHEYQVEPNRESAIRKILQMAEPGDVVVVAGKGHETYQVLSDRTIHFDDREMARAVLKEMGYCHETVLS